jgi:DNA-binding XRE family transcriptional regulator
LPVRPARSAAGRRSRATAVGRRSSNRLTAGAAAANGKAPCSGGGPLYLAGCRLFGRLVYRLSRKVERDVQRRLLKMRERLEIRRRSQRLSKPGPDAGPRTHSTAPRELALQQLEALIGLEVRRLRKSRDLTVAQLGAAAGISTGMLSKVENGATSPSLATLHALATALSVPITQLFARTDDYRYCSVDGETREHTAIS